MAHERSGDIMARRVIRRIIGTLLGIIALNAFGGGIYGMMGAEGIPVVWLRGSPFTSYFIPSLVLFVVVGGLSLAAVIAVFAHWRHAHRIVTATVAVIFIWLAVQISIIGYVSWMQPAVAITAFIILVLGVIPIGVLHTAHPHAEADGRKRGAHQ
jgi:hypothetical protein